MHTDVTERITRDTQTDRQTDRQTDVDERITTRQTVVDSSLDQIHQHRLQWKTIFLVYRSDAVLPKPSISTMHRLQKISQHVDTYVYKPRIIEVAVIQLPVWYQLDFFDV